ncbi:MAG: shikimate dehydrogenase [Lachnospiraceae bacterium]|nr:shikimate dehydrogenase [Lachnospiraceae bacterium]
MIDGKTRLICLLGHPVGHSLSPAMHNAAFEKLDLPYAYLAFDCLPENLPAVIDGLRMLNFRGANLTMPLKRDVLPLADELSLVSRVAGSVNTLTFMDDSRLVGTTTDGIGLTESLKFQHVDYIGKNVTLLGAGGAATAIAAQLAVDGAAAIDIFQRKSKTFERAEELAEKINSQTPCRARVIDQADADALQNSLKKSTVLINATNVGMGEDASSLVPEEFLLPGLFVYDIIYEPAETTLLRTARERGLRTSNGADMLLYQGAASFKCWTGQDMPVEYVRERVFSRSS